MPLLPPDEHQELILHKVGEECKTGRPVGAYIRLGADQVLTSRQRDQLKLRILRALEERVVALEKQLKKKEKT